MDEERTEELEEESETSEEETEIAGDETEETQETELDAEATLESSPEDKGTQDKDKVQKRIDELTWEKRETERKLDQFKRLGPEGYYQLYPEEKLEEEESDTTGVTDTVDTDVGNLVVKGGKYDGQTVREVLAVDPAEGNLLLINYYQKESERKATEKAERQRIQDEADQELANFTNEIANDLFGKSDELDEDQTTKVKSVIDLTLSWMEKTGRGGGIIADAYALMTLDTKLKDKSVKTLKAIVDAMKTDETTSISSSKTSSADVGYARFLHMTDNQAAMELEKFSDDEQDEFLKKAPPEVRKKFPSLPWG